MEIPNTNDGSQNPPSLKAFLNLWTLGDLPSTSSAPKGSLAHQYEAIRNHGFTGLQEADPKVAKEAGLAIAASGRVNEAAEVEPLVAEQIKEEYVATTLHVGWGFEDDTKIDELVSKILEISDTYKYPLYIETHRATIAQDNWRTVQIARRFPDIRFNGDFSHWYTGHEMVYGKWEEKRDFIEPILDRVRFIHGRISTPGSIQAPLSRDLDSPYITHFRELWRGCFRGFLKTAQPGDYVIFAPELLNPKIYYALTYIDKNGNKSEHSDRWEDALFLKKIAEEEFANAAAS